MIISARRTLSSVLQKKLLVKFSRQYHSLMKITFADNQHELDSRTTSALHILDDLLYEKIKRSDFNRCHAQMIRQSLRKKVYVCYLSILMTLS